MPIVLFQTIQFSMSTWFNCQKHFHFKLFKQLYITIQFRVSAVSKSKTFLFQTTQLFLTIQFSQAVLIQLIQFSISTDFLYTQLIFKTVLC